MAKRKRKTAAGHSRAICNVRKKRLILAYYFGAQCLRCKRLLTDSQITLDHVLPAAKGGRGNITNLQILCFNCNRDKADKIGDYRPWTIVSYINDNLTKIYEDFA